ncbi:unnamed protein product [Rotaria sp. Silwood1]|nr:unnamed protein product [Rotaria sp. Silwood1]
MSSSRGLQIFRDLGVVNQVNLSSTSPPYPSIHASQAWTDDALYVSSSSLSETVWLIGFIRVPKSNNFTFILDTNGAAALFLSTNDNPANKVKICDARNIQSNVIALKNDTNYYLFCVGSRTNGYLRLGIQARIYETTLTAGTSSFVLNEIQQIDINTTIISERQRIVYTTNITNGISEVQSLQVDSSTFQIGFRATFTGRPTATTIQTALNDLPSIFPLTVSVSATSTLYFITFPIAMGDVPLLTCISLSSNIPNITEVTQGVSSGSKLFFSLNDQFTNSIDFINTNITQTNLLTLFNNLFSIRCPPSINNAQITSSIVYVQDYETNCIYDTTPITINAFCGQCSYIGNVLINGNTRSGNYLCFAYRLLNNYVTSIMTSVQIIGDTIQTIWQEIPFTTIADHNWHYTCIDIRTKLISQSAIASSVSSIIITYAALSRNINRGIIIDTVSIRTVLPYGYDNISSYSNIQSLNSSCIFPFYYNGKSYSTCILNENDIPICADSFNQTYSCFSSAMEGVRRLYPKQQLVYNTLKVQYTPANSTIDVSFRYSDCTNPSLLNAIITRITTASSPASGTFDLIFNGQTYSSIPVDISTLDLTNRLQSSSDFGFLNITRLHDCTGYSYRIEWLTNGGKKTPISIANIDSISPNNTTITASVIQSGGIIYKPLPGDMTRTYHTNPQIEVFVGGYSSKCSSSNACDFQWLSTQTPSVSSIEQDDMTLTIIGTGFSTTASSNEIIIGTEGSCTIISATTTSLICTIIGAPSGTYTIQVNVADKGLATGTSNLTITIPLEIISISPIEGGAGGGYTIILTGSGFSSSSIVTIDNNLCTDLIMFNFSSITCTVPPTTAINDSEVSVIVTDGSNFISASTQFIYNVTNTPSITSVSSNVVNTAGGQLTINGTNFGTSSVSVFIGTIKATVISISSTQVLAILPSLAPGIYPMKVSTINGYARPLVQIEYRFYIQNISPQIGSLYGGTDVYIQGEGFDDSSVVTFTDDNNNNNNNKPCTIVSIESNQIHCQTTSAISRVIITSDGIDPIYGSGFAWSPQYLTVQQEDGVETGNILNGNLAVFVRTSSSLLNEDVTPAAFWVTNPNNIVVNNAVAGGTHFGYWYRMLRTPDGPSFAMYPNYCPYRRQFGRFFNNSVHSVGRFGVWIFPEYSPTVAGNCWNDAPYQAIFDGLISWKNSKGFEWVMSSSIQIRNTIVFDNYDTGLRCVTAINHQATNLPNLRATFYNETRGSSVINSIIIGDSGVSGNPIVPTEGGLVVMWDRGLRVRNVSFINFSSSNTQAIYGPFITGRCIVYCGGWLTKFSQLSFTNVANRGNFRWPYDGLYQDEDGSLSNVSGTIILAPDGLWNTSNACRPTPNFINAITCPLSLGTWIRFAFNKASLGQNGEYLNVYDQFNHHTIVLNLAKRLTHPLGYMMTLLSKNIYLFQFQNANSSVNLSYSGIAYGLEPGDYLIIRHKIDYKPDIVYTTSSSLVSSQSNTPLNGSTNNNGDWHYNANTSIFSYMVKNPSSNIVSIDVSISLNIIKCRYPNCQPPPQPGLELPATVRPTTALYWSNNSDWSFALAGYGGYGSIKPGNDTNILIPRGIWLVVNYPLPRIRSLRIDGVLEFEQGIDNTLVVDSILINGGQLIVGWPNKPLTSKVDIIINGSSSINVLLPNDAGSIGPQVIGVLGGLDLHGLKRNVSWTRLVTTASSGQNSIILSQPVDWKIGEEIILTTTDTNIEHTERHTIANISIDKTKIITVNPLVYTHVVIHNVFPDGKIFHIAGAVGLLTRNIRVINRSPASELFGFRILVTDYAVNIWNSVANDYIYTYYKGYARLSNTQFIGYGQYVDAANEDKREGIHLYNLGNWNSSRPTYIDSCSFDGGYYSAIGVWDTNGIPITNNVVYKTYESAIVVTGKNNIVEKNLVSSIYWSGTAQPKLAEFNTNNDGAIMSKDAISVIMRDNLVAGVERLAYRIQGNSCSGTVLPNDITNDYSNNEVHSAMSGFNIWPMDKGFEYDSKCILIHDFKTYKAWYYGLYINTARNIIIDSCTVADGNVGIFTLVIGPTAISHVAGNNSVTILNSMVIGSITPDDCNDTPNTTTVSSINSIKAIPTVSATSSAGDPGGRSGIVFPFFSRDNLMPRHPWTGIAAYPCIDGLMTITNVTLAFYNDICSRRDIAIQVGQHNDDGQHPIVTKLISVYNTSQMNLIFNGRPNLNVVNPSDCVDMDCDGLKKNLLIDTDGTLFGQPTSVFSQAEYLWGDQQHGVGDYRIPSVALANLTGHMININTLYPNRGISRAPTCIYRTSWQMYFCPNTTDYRMLVIENMDSDTETRRLSPVAIMSDNGYIDLINGPQDHGWCNGYTCQKRISTFMSLVQSRHRYDVYLSSTTPNHIRFRLLNSDSSIVNILSLYYDSLQQIDVYANNIYVSPVNRDLSYSYLILTDQPNNITFTSTPGSNYFNRKTRMASFLINGITVIDLKISELVVLNFNLPPQTPSSFFSSNLTANLAAILGVSPDKIRRVNIVAANNNYTGRIRRQLSTIELTVEIRDDPVANLSTNSTVETEPISNICAAIINRYQSGELHRAWAENPFTGNTTPTDLSIQEPFNQSSISLSIIHRIELVTPPSSCREQSPCAIQPKLIAYDEDGNVIEKLGSNDQPWQVMASVVDDSNITLIGAIANYSNGQTQYTSFGLSATGHYQVQFAFIQPNNVTSSFMSNINLTANSSSLTITKAILAAKQIDHIYVVSINETFNISVVIVDSQSHLPIGNIHWRDMTWSANVSLYNLPEFNSNGTLTKTNTSSIIINPIKSTIIATDLVIDTIGMYVIKVQLASSNNEYAFSLVSNGILVKKNSTTLNSNSGAPSSYIIFDGDYDKFQTNGLLEIKRAIIYNYLICIGMPIATDITVTKGSILAWFDVNADPTSLASALDSIASDPNAMSDLIAKSININGNTYSTSASSSDSTTETSSSNNKSLIIVIVVCVVVGSAIIIFSVYFGIRAYKKQYQRRRLIDEPTDQYSTVNAETQSDENITAKTEPKKNNFQLTQPILGSVGLSAKNTNQVKPLITNMEKTDRPPSGSVSVTMLDFTNVNSDDRANASLSAVQSK